MGEIQLVGDKVEAMGPLGAVLARERRCIGPKSLGEVATFPRAVLPCRQMDCEGGKKVRGITHVAKTSRSTIPRLSGHPLLNRWFAEWLRISAALRRRSDSSSTTL